MIDNQTLDQKIYIPTDFLRIHSRTFSKVRRNSFLRVFSMKTNTPFLIMQHGGEVSATSAIQPHIVLYFMYGCYRRFAPSSKLQHAARLYTLRTPYTLHFSLYTKKSPSKTIFLAQSKIIHYLCRANHST